MKITKAILLDPRDLPFIWQILRVSILFLPLSFWILLDPSVSPWITLLYLPFTVFLLGPQLLMVHNICHRNPWRKPIRPFLNSFVSFQNLFFGLPPMIYFHHHIKMHHKEGNGPGDLSTTLGKQRDSFRHWFVYFLRFSFGTPFELPRYFFRQGRADYAYKVILGYLIFTAVFMAAGFYNLKGALIVFYLPTLISWFGMMAGNWTQHAFIHPDHPADDFLSSITLVESLYNRRCFNDGYHIAHHRFPGMHWSEMPSEFDKNLNLYQKKESLVFRKLDYQAIWFYLMFKNYKGLSAYMVPTSQNQESMMDRISLIKERVKA